MAWLVTKCFFRVIWSIASYLWHPSSLLINIKFHKIEVYLKSSCLPCRFGYVTKRREVGLKDTIIICYWKATCHESKCQISFSFTSILMPCFEKFDLMVCNNGYSFWEEYAALYWYRAYWGWPIISVNQITLAEYTFSSHTF